MRRLAALLVLLLGATAARAEDAISFGLDWVAEAEYGGYYQALATGIYARHGLKVTIRQGGPQVNQMQLMMAGRLDFNLGGGRAIEFVQQNLPFVAIAAMFQKDPSVLIAHPGQGNDSFAALKGKPILIGADTRASWWRFLAGKFGYTRCADPPLHLQPAAVPRRQDVGAAGLSRLRAVRDRAGGAFQAGGAAARRCGLCGLCATSSPPARSW